MRIAAIDIGTNSIHMIVVQVRPDLSFEVIDREKDMVRLGAGGLAHRHAGARGARHQRRGHPLRRPQPQPRLAAAAAGGRAAGQLRRPGEGACQARAPRRLRGRHRGPRARAARLRRIEEPIVDDDVSIYARDAVLTYLLRDLVEPR